MFYVHPVVTSEKTLIENMQKKTKKEYLYLKKKLSIKEYRKHQKSYTIKNSGSKFLLTGDILNAAWDP